MESQSDNLTVSLKNKVALVRSVFEIFDEFPVPHTATMTIELEKSGVRYVATVTIESSVATETPDYYDVPPGI